MFYPDLLGTFCMGGQLFMFLYNFTGCDFLISFPDAEDLVDCVDLVQSLADNIF